MNIDWSKVETAEDKIASERELLIANLEAATVNHIQSAVDEYNKLHGLTYKDVHSCGNYRHDIGYTHQEFCANVWAWNVAVWEKCRELLAIGEELTAEELIAQLPKL